MKAFAVTAMIEKSDLEKIEYGYTTAITVAENSEAAIRKVEEDCRRKDPQFRFFRPTACEVDARALRERGAFLMDRPMPEMADAEMVSILRQVAKDMRHAGKASLDIPLLDDVADRMAEISRENARLRQENAQMRSCQSA